MAHHKSAIKRIRKSIREREHNRSYKMRLKKAVKELLECTSKDKAEEKIKPVFQILDRMSMRNVIHRNRAAHQKSKYSRFVNSL